MWNRKRKLLLIGPVAILGMLLFAFIGGEIVKWLWNAVLPDLFGWRAITFWQALGVLALTRILVGGFGLHRSGRSGFRMRMAERMSDRMADQVGERWERMTPEERERFRHRMRERCGFDPASTESKSL